MSERATGRVTVRVPATSANLGPGFDSFGLCLDLADVVTADVTASGTEIDVVGEGAADVADDDTHLVVSSMRAAFDLWGVAQPGLRLSCRNAIPQGRGLGSSAAAIVAGLRLAEALVPGQRLGSEDVLAYAAGIEGHPDNVAACLLGGFTIAWTDEGRVSAVRLDVDPGVVPVVLCAPAPLSTLAARALLPKVVDHAYASANVARASVLVAALTTHPELLLAATEDFIHQESRRTAMPETLNVVDNLRAIGIPAVVSGAGPSVLGLCSALQAERVDELAPAGWQCLRLAVDLLGARLVRS